MDWNRLLIRANWVALIVSVIATPINVALYLTHRIDEKTLILITLVLSWLAIILSAGATLVAAYVKADVES